MITSHAQTRLNDRFQKYADAATIAKIEEASDKFVSQTYFVAKRFSKNIVVTDKNGHHSCGDMMVAVIRDRVAVTVILVKSTRKDYFNDGQLVDLK